MFGQYDQDFTYAELSKNVEVVTGIYSVQDSAKGLTFKNGEGLQYSDYFPGHNFIKGGLIFYDRKNWRDPRDSNGNDDYQVVPLMKVVKEFNAINETYVDKFPTTFRTRQKEAQDAIKDFLRASLVGLARKGDKYAYITKFGELVTGFKYQKDNYGIYRIDSLSDKKF